MRSLIMHHFCGYLLVLFAVLIHQSTAEGSPVITLSHTTIETHALLPPEVNTADITVLTLNVTLETNVTGKWQAPDNTNITDSTFAIPVFAANHGGLYRFYVSKNGSDVLAIQISISVVGTRLAEQTASAEYIILSDNNIFHTNTTLVCATNDTSQQIQWTYQPNQDATENETTSLWNTTTGISSIEIMTSQQGYYTCKVRNVTYTVAVFNPMVTTVATAGMSYYYIKGIDQNDIQLLCDQENTSINLNTITWRDTTTNSTYNNPVVINNIAASLNLTCYMESVATFSVQITIYDPMLMLSYTGFDTTNYGTVSPDPISITIPLYSTDVTLITNIESGTWTIPIYPFIPNNTAIIQLFTLESPGRYSFNTNQTWNGEVKEIFAIDISQTGSPVAIETSSGQYTVQPINSIFYADTWLVCTSEPGSLVYWGHQTTFSKNVQGLTATTLYGIGKFKATLDLEGYYNCEITMDGIQVTYYMGVFTRSPTATTAVTGGNTYNYTVGIDSDGIQLHCDPMDTTINLRNVSWLIGGSPHPNPVTVRSLVNIELPSIMEIYCYVTIKSDIRIQATLNIQGEANLAVFYDGADPQYFGQPYGNTIIQIPTYAQNVVIQSNLLFGSWSQSLGGYEIGTDLNIPIMSLQHNGDVQFSVKFWESSQEEVVLKISVFTQGTNIGRIEGLNEITPLSNGTAIQPSTSVSIVCATDNSTSNIEWLYSIVGSDHVISKTSSADFNSTTGFSILEISAEEPGQYACVIDGSISHNIFILDPTSTIITLDDFNSTIEIGYTAGSPTMLYYENIDSTIADSSIRWTPERVLTSEDRIYSPEFGNPVSLDEVFSVVGSGDFVLRCFYRMSPATVLGGVNLDIRDSVVVTITYGDTTMTFDDATNNMFPMAQTLEIPVLTTNIQFDCSLITCLWTIDLDNQERTELAIKPYTIELLMVEHAGIFAVKRSSSNSTVYTTADFELKVTGAFEQTIKGIYPETLDSTTIGITWDLTFPQTNDSNEMFTIYYGIGNTDIIAGMTQAFSYNLTGLTSNQNYTIRIELSYAFTIQTSSKEIIHFFEYIAATNLPETQNSTTTLIVVAVVVILLLTLGILMVLLTLLIWLNTRKPRQFVKSNLLGEEPEIVSMEKAKSIEHNTQYTNPNFAPNLIDEQHQNVPKILSSTSAYENITINENAQDNPYFEPIQLEYYKHHMDTVWSQRNALESEYKSLGGTQRRYSWTAAKIEGSSAKNKFIDTLPYDKSRVILMQEGNSVLTSYINASYIPGVYVPHTFIAAQGPKESTVEDFWRMVMEHEVNDIVMVTNLREGGKQKCEKYFATENLETFGRYKVVFCGEDMFASHVIRRMTVMDGTLIRNIRQFHFTAWPDHDVPTTFKDILEFVNIVKSSILNAEKPIVVHCSAGVGRTGTFLTLFNLLEAIQNQQPISIYRVVHEMREHRPQMVQTFRQYKFIYLSILELLYQNTVIAGSEFPSTFQRFMESEKEGTVSILFEQYYELEYQSEKGFPLECYVGMDMLNDTKNPIKNALPCDHNRVVLSSEDLPVDYINASYLDSYKYILTINPVEDTILDFLQMLYQTQTLMVIMITTPKEYADIVNRQSNCVPYWPNMPEFIDVMPFRTEVVESEEVGGLIRNVIKLTNWYENRMHTFTQIISTSWDENDEPVNTDEVIDILNILQNETEVIKHRPIVLHCIDGIGKSGVVYTVYKSIQNLQQNNEVDIFQLVKQLRRQRMNFVPSLTNYTSCYSLLNAYFTSNNLYQ
ncbi:hypothetical protein LOD99_6036 [Oopsacas minuta]|uniref:protein-tyrosine-phosphatase n=1 Tax=Oopsacas minuta TaxID=111878 RepID=A0AAV7JPA2_9METZ|nr:hypothetical protein LOD99_6036 [Oopsacas minuta]